MACVKKQKNVNVNVSTEHGKFVLLALYTMPLNHLCTSKGNVMSTAMWCPREDKYPSHCQLYKYVHSSPQKNDIRLNSGMHSESKWVAPPLECFQGWTAAPAHFLPDHARFLMCFITHRI